eukprot:CAMPEP_0201659122 /NCGR_PEP_ID=MMETSP0494-20130426/1985_1 /ASSEMBLY_ACC=CAM_ASM_000839 /TAXON_ID=420259 /ORGANISM="Thalassiosira gravida, Strain GMp14c1" /LENGTH=32 /DNA_ID= /DNA_START= /DNA_END= /DNA_ORIENTATION=
MGKWCSAAAKSAPLRLAAASIAHANVRQLWCP